MSLSVKRVLATGLLLGSVCGVLSAQKAPDSSVVFTGADWAVAVREPAGWRAHCCSGEKWGANLVLYRDSLSLAVGSGLIRIVVANKSDENTQADLQADMDAYTRERPDVRFDTLTASHPRYRVFARVFMAAGRFYEYVAYLNPGPSFHHVLSIAFNKQGAPASAQELKAYREALASLVVIR